MIKIGKWIKSILIFLSIVFLTFQPMLVPVVHAVDSWSEVDRFEFGASTVEMFAGF
ncbi:hypothetical protein J2Z83_000750 [Virgibacillus natechei]|uniref:Uncharacterized protein n=1 Tax=Virgibacillus natechei TaxID=1216297 RepID=A0ABS4ICI8_9BACI|nr:hypothetical protein [Virgibacillus natechei]MBP1968658.1 hypothetical protein [Virgibacillus natechei]UZD13762.1 hypothetical protein OLD84_04200 [Virgibacillus natechei]